MPGLAASNLGCSGVVRGSSRYFPAVLKLEPLTFNPSVLGSNPRRAHHTTKSRALTLRFVKGEAGIVLLASQGPLVRHVTQASMPDAR